MDELAVALDKFKRMKAGERVVTNDKQLDILSAHFTAHDGDDANIYFRSVVSKPNPKRVGILDQYVAWIKE